MSSANVLLCLAILPIAINGFYIQQSRPFISSMPLPAATPNFGGNTPLLPAATPNFGANTLYLTGDAPDLPDYYFYFPRTNTAGLAPNVAQPSVNVVAPAVASVGTRATVRSVVPRDGTYIATSANGRLAYEVTRDGTDISYDRLG